MVHSCVAQHCVSHATWFLFQLPPSERNTNYCISCTSRQQHQVSALKLMMWCCGGFSQSRTGLSSAWTLPVFLRSWFQRTPPENTKACFQGNHLGMSPCMNICPKRRKWELKELHAGLLVCLHAVVLVQRTVSLTVIDVVKAGSWNWSRA